MAAGDLTEKQELFVQAYCGEAKGNASEAARIAGYAHPLHQACKIKWSPAVRARIDEYLKANALLVGEALQILSEQAQGSLADFFTVSANGKPTFDLKKAQRLGKLRLIKRLKVAPDGSADIELHDPQAAATLLLRYHGAFKDKLEVTVHDDGADAALDRKLASLAAARGAAPDPEQPDGSGENTAPAPVGLLGPR